MSPLYLLRSTTVIVVLGIAHCASKPAGAQVPPSFDDLSNAMSKRLLPDSELPRDLIGCPPFDPMALPREDYDDYQFQRQWIFNGAYYWILLRTAVGTCVVLTGDQQRSITPAESRALLSAAKLNVPDVLHPDQQAAFNCLARADGRFGGDVPAYESGVINGRRYRVFFAPIAQELKPLDEAQHRFGEIQKSALMRLSRKRRGPMTDSTFDLVLSFRRTGRTAQLASMEGIATHRNGAETPTETFKNWLLDVTHGKLISFADLFNDPRVAQAYVADTYRDNASKHVDFMMRDLTFIGDDADQQARSFRARLIAAIYRSTSGSAPHLLRIEIPGLLETDTHFFTGTFSSELLPDGTPLFWQASQDELKPFLKPQFSSVLAGERCPKAASP